MGERDRPPAGPRGKVLGHLVPGLAAALLVAAGPAMAAPSAARPAGLSMCLAKGNAVRQYRWAAGAGPPAGLPTHQERAAWAKAARARLPETIVRDGRTYRRADRQRIELPLGRYHPYAAPVAGLPAVAPLGGRGKVVLVLTGPSGCWFDRFVAEPAPDAREKAPGEALSCAVPRGASFPPPAVIDQLLARAGVLRQVEDARLDQMERDILYAYARRESLARLQRRFPWLGASDAERLRATLAGCPEA